MTEPTDAIWDDLEALCAEAAAAGAESGAMADALREHLARLQPALDHLDRFMAETRPHEAADLVRTRLLGGAGVVHQTWYEFRLERLTVLQWPSYVDPRPELAGAAGEYRVEVWIGLNEQGRARVRVQGAKRLEALLPVAPEKFRAAFLAAVRAPAFQAHDTGADETAAAEMDEQPGAMETGADGADGADTTEDTAAPSAPDEPIAMGPTGEAEAPA